MRARRIGTRATFLARSLLLPFLLSACGGSSQTSSASSALVSTASASPSRSGAGEATAAVSPAASAGSGAPGLPREAMALFPAGARVLDSKPLGSGASGGLAAVIALPDPPGASAGSVPPMAELAIVDKAPAGWRLAKAVIEGFAQAPKLDLVHVAAIPAAGMEYHTGANSQGLVVVRNNAVVFDAVADAVQLQDLNHDGSAEVVKAWSPFCQSHVASPRIRNVYAWQQGQFALATSSFPEIVAGDAQNFRAAVARANDSKTTPPWTAADKACLHDSLGYLAELADNRADAAAENTQVRQLDPSYDPEAIKKAAAGEPAKTNPR